MQLNVGLVSFYNQGRVILSCSAAPNTSRYQAEARSAPATIMWMVIPVTSPTLTPASPDGSCTKS